ncbi:E6 [Martes foina papillomavirus 1]|uniref:Protein E6 n=1 Tax=Martes foina papillomavirus 1 TaxID=2831903 RepID=A0AAE7USU4_9PAPI|nr:E6 [Martes foina papillomavirus 1]
MEQPSSVAELCRRACIAVEDVNILCIFCGGLLTVSELCAYDLKGLQLIWRGGSPRGCCGACCRASAAVERRQYMQGWVTGRNLHTILKSDLVTTTVRCVICLKLLSTAEKVAVVLAEQIFELIRGRWRARCRLCTKSNNDWERAYTKRYLS